MPEERSDAEFRLVHLASPESCINLCLLPLTSTLLESPLRLSLFAVAATLCMSSLAAHADTAYDLTGTFASGAALGGTFTTDADGHPYQIDATVTQAGVTSTYDVTGSYSYSLSDNYSDVAGTTNPPKTSLDELALFFPESSLQGVTTTSLCSTTVSCLNVSGLYLRSTNANVDPLASGTATISIPASVTPEPSSFALLGTGILGVTGVMRKRLA